MAYASGLCPSLVGISAGVPTRKPSKLEFNPREPTDGGDDALVVAPALAMTRLMCAVSGPDWLDSHCFQFSPPLCLTTTTMSPSTTPASDNSSSPFARVRPEWINRCREGNRSTRLDSNSLALSLSTVSWAAMLSSSLAPFFRLRILSLISRARLPRDPGEEVGEDESGNS